MNLIWLAPSRYPLQLRWRALAAAEAGAAASRAAGMPMRRPIRPAAVSAATVADAEPDLCCAGELEQPLKALIGKVCRPRSIARSLGRSLDRLWSSFRFICVGVLCLGSSAGAGALGFPVPGYWIDGRPAFVCVSSSVMGAVCACLLT